MPGGLDTLNIETTFLGLAEGRPERTEIHQSAGSAPLPQEMNEGFQAFVERNTDVIKSLGATTALLEGWPDGLSVESVGTSSDDVFSTDETSRTDGAFSLYSEAHRLGISTALSLGIKPLVSILSIDVPEDRTLRPAFACGVAIDAEPLGDIVNLFGYAVIPAVVANQPSAADAPGLRWIAQGDTIEIPIAEYVEPSVYRVGGQRPPEKQGIVTAGGSLVRAPLLTDNGEPWKPGVAAQVAVPETLYAMRQTSIYQLSLPTEEDEAMMVTYRLKGRMLSE